LWSVADPEKLLADKMTPEIRECLDQIRAQAEKKLSPESTQR
jgi:hypothetical protein